MTITPRNSWPILEPLLDFALDLASVEREPWLAELSARSPDLAAELRALMAEDAKADLDGFLSDPRDLSLAGHQLGAYQLERPLGQGGMGSVWLARRADGHFEGTAAVKLLHLSLLSTQGQERFQQEGSVLARLAHPGIARLLDAGVTAAGQPYLILEYVDGVPIDGFARDRQLSQADRIRLFLQVLAAVGHAHANLIVHRDLKPSNMLVNADGVVKLLDFGIAKLLDDRSGAEFSAISVGGTRVFTPEYAAPEQVWGDSLTTATDVYALGVLLYILLSGRHPTNEEAHTPRQILAALIEAEPKPLGLGDLDAVVAKALRKAPAERYQTVAAFADDLERYLGRQPVSARHQSLTYRLGKFVQRNRLAVAAAALVVGALVGATIFSLGRMNEARRQRDTALRSAERSQAMSRIQAVLAGDSRGGDGRPLTTRERIDLAEHVLTREFHSRPWLVSDLLANLSERYYEMGDRPAQRAMLARAQELARSAASPGQLALASCMRAYSFAFDDLLDSARGDLATAKSALTQPGFKPEPELQALCLDAEGQTLVAAGESQAGIPLLVRAASLADTDVKSLQLQLLNDLASGLRLGGRTREAIPYQRRVLAELDSAGYGNTEEVPNMATFLAGSLAELGEMVAADSEIRPLIREQEAVHGTGHVSTLLAFLYGQGKLRLGVLDSADLWIGRAMRDTTEGAGAISDWLPATLTELRLDEGRLPEARRAGARLSGGPRGRRATTAMLKARLIRAGGDAAGSAALLEGELRSLETDGGPPLSHFALPLVFAGEWRLSSGDARGADSLAQAAHRAAVFGDSLGSERSGYAGRADLLQARARSALGDRLGAFTAAEHAILALSNGYGPNHPLTREARGLRDSLRR